jgi:hypothetical protein
MASRIPASSPDRRNWGRGFRGFPGGFGTGSFEEKPEMDGRLCGSIPVSEPQLKAIWDEFGIGKGDSSAWHRIGDFSQFLVVFDAVKFSRFPFRRFWHCEISFWCSHAHGKDPIEIRGLRYFCGLSVPDLLDAAERLVKRLEIPPPIPENIRKRIT